MFSTVNRDTYGKSKERAMDVRRLVFTIKVVKGEDGYFVAYCKEIPGCASQGKTVKEALANVKEALLGCLEALAQEATAEVAVKPFTGSVVKTQRLALAAVPA